MTHASMRHQLAPPVAAVARARLRRGRLGFCTGAMPSFSAMSGAGVRRPRAASTSAGSGAERRCGARRAGPALAGRRPSGAARLRLGASRPGFGFGFGGGPGAWSASRCGARAVGARPRGRASSARTRRPRRSPGSGSVSRPGRRGFFAVGSTSAAGVRVRGHVPELGLDPVPAGAVLGLALLPVREHGRGDEDRRVRAGGDADQQREREVLERRAAEQAAAR